MEKTPSDGLTISKCKYEEASLTFQVMNSSFSMPPHPPLWRQTMIMMSIVVAILTAPINLLIDYLFVDILSAPSVDDAKMQRDNELRESHFGRVVKKAGDTLRRASTVTADTVKVARRRFGMTIAHESVQIPETTKEAHELARDSAQQIIQEHRDIIDKEKSSRSMTRSQMLVRRHRNQQSRSTQSPVSQHHSKSKGGPDDSLYSEALTELFCEFVVDLNDQRRLLKPSIRERYDTQWG